MKLSREEILTALACVIGLLIMFLNQKSDDERIFSLLIIPVLMLLYIRKELKKDKKK